MKALIDADILRYECAYAASASYKYATETDDQPPYDWVDSILNKRIDAILSHTGSHDYTLYLTEGRTFRYDLAVTTPYKGSRTAAKPWHFNNLTAVMTNAHPHRIANYVEADDALVIDHMKELDDTIICSRDKDLRQSPGNIYSWEMGLQPSFGPFFNTDNIGWLKLSRSGGTVIGRGYTYFCAQVIMGDRADNINGIIGAGAGRAFKTLSPILSDNDIENKEEAMWLAVEKLYEEKYGEGWENILTEMAQLLWIVRRLNEDGSPQLWEKGLTS